MIETIVFDMDGVIFDTERLGLECWELLADKYGLEGIRPVAMKCIGRNTEATTRIMLDHYGEDLDIQGLYNESKTVMKQLMEKNG
ncbi:MAG: HAD hydrolase-like protein, partial [Ruminococcus sp.]|nr:HAD hydrolase-like protein [Ruminococcus sp.]